MKTLEETIAVRDPKTGEIYCLCDIKVVLSWYLYPHIFILEEKYLSIPSLKLNHFGLEGSANPGLPHNLQKAWFKCLFSWKRFRQKEIIPYIANLEYYRLTGGFANGVVSYFNEKIENQ